MSMEKKRLVDKRACRCRGVASSCLECCCIEISVRSMLGVPTLNGVLSLVSRSDSNEHGRAVTSGSQRGRASTLSCH